MQGMLGNLCLPRKARPGPDTQQLLMGVLAPNPVCVPPLPAWASIKSRGQGLSSSGCVGSRLEAGVQPLESCSGWVDDLWLLG